MYDYCKLCHSNTPYSITHMVYEDLKWKVDKGFGTKADLKALNILEHDLVNIIAYAGSWWVETNSRYTRVPNYFIDWGKRFLLKHYNIVGVYKGV